MLSLEEKKTRSAEVTLAILAGGRSSRFGTDKGLWRPLGDESLVVRSLRLLGQNFDEILIIVKDSEQASLYRQELDLNLNDPEIAPRIKIISDQGPTNAALTGIHAALRQSSKSFVAIVPVDQVGIRRRHLEQLVYSQVQASAFTPIAFTNDAPFPSLWPKSTASHIETLIQSGAFSVQGALRSLNATEITPNGNPNVLETNINTLAEGRAYFGEPLIDPFKRRLHYLRFSLTEACNLSCTYCLPDGFPEWYRHKARLNTKDIGTILRGFRQLGFRKARFTGGEPTVHPGCLAAVQDAADAGYEEIALSTNGLLIKDLNSWRNAGLTQVNISLDSINPDVFFKMAKSRDVARVIDTVEAAVAAGITTKINAVVMRHINLDATDALIEWALKLPITLRFIELMPTGLNQTFSTTERVLNSELKPKLDAFGLKPLASTSGLASQLRGPAQIFTSPDHIGKIGLINPLSSNFCGNCNRLRMTARGSLRLCLFGDNDLPLDLTSPESVVQSVRAVIHQKPERHHLEENQFGNVSTFRTIGG